MGAKTMWILRASAYTALLVSAAAAALCLAVARALGTPLSPFAPAVAAGGTLFIYNLDRLRDRNRDRDTAPGRTAFVDRYTHVLVALAGAGLLAALVALPVLGPRAVGVLIPAAALGLLHRRLKRLAYAKAAYLAAAWLCVCVGLPAASAPSVAPAAIAHVAFVAFCALFANAVASSIRDDEAATARLGPNIPKSMAIAVAAAGTIGALAVPGPARSLVALPLLTLAAVAGPVKSQDYGLIVVDGALLAGALVSLTTG